MKHNTDRKLVALNNGAGNVSTAAIDLGSSGGAHVRRGNFLIQLPLQSALADAGTVTCDIMHCATVGGSYTVCPGYGNQIVTGAGGAGAPATEFRMPIAPHVLQFVKARFTQVGTGNNSGVSGELAIEI